MNAWVFVLAFMLSTIICTYQIWKLKKNKLSSREKNRFGMHQKWKCWTCGTIMLSDFECCVFDKNIRAVCINCGQTHRNNAV